MPPQSFWGMCAHHVSIAPGKGGGEYTTELAPLSNYIIMHTVIVKDKLGFKCKMVTCPSWEKEMFKRHSRVLLSPLLSTKQHRCKLETRPQCQVAEKFNHNPKLKGRIEKKRCFLDTLF